MGNKLDGCCNDDELKNNVNINVLLVLLMH